MTDSRYLSQGTILDQYTISKHLASGGFGNTYLAHNRLGTQVVIKEFYLSGVCSRDINSRNVTISVEDNKTLFESQKTKFIKEAKRIHALSHPNVVKVTDLIEANETAYYVMDYIDGKSLAQMQKPLSEIKVRHYLNQIMSALEYIHSQGLLHLDIKPSNIMIDSNDNAILIDFGASKLYDAQGANHSILTTTTGITFTPGYAPFEQMSNHLDALGTYSDIYAIGATLYNLLTGEKPPQPLSIHENGLPQIPNISPALMNAINGATMYFRKERIKTIAELKAVLNGEQTIAMPSASAPQRNAPQSKLPPMRQQMSRPMMNQQPPMSRPMMNQQAPMSRPPMSQPYTYNHNSNQNKKNNFILPIILGIVAAILAVVVIIVVNFNSNQSEAPIANATDSTNTSQTAAPAVDLEAQKAEEQARLAEEEARKAEERRQKEEAARNRKNYGNCTLTGKLNGKHALTIYLTNGFNGHLKYKSGHANIPVYGSCSNGYLEIEEVTDGYGLTGVFRGTFDGNIYSGTYTREKDYKEFSFRFTAK